MRIMDVLLAFPAILLALLVVAIEGPGTITSITAIGIVYTPIFARVVRGPALSLKSARIRRSGANLRQLAGLHPHAAICCSTSSRR